VTLFFQQRRKSRPRSTAEIQPLLLRIEPFEQRLAQAGQKTPVSRILRRILMEIVDGLFFRRRQSVTAGDKNQPAMSALPIDSVFILKKENRIFTAAEGAVGVVSFDVYFSRFAYTSSACPDHGRIRIEWGFPGLRDAVFTGVFSLIKPSIGPV